jgi:hypothetical protein
MEARQHEARRMEQSGAYEVRCLWTSSCLAKSHHSNGATLMHTVKRTISWKWHVQACIMPSMKKRDASSTDCTGDDENKDREARNDLSSAIVSLA